MADETNKILRTVVKQIRKEFNGNMSSNSPFFVMAEFPTTPLESFPAITVSVFENDISERRMGGLLFSNEKGEIQRMGVQIDVFSDKSTFWQNTSQATLVRRAMDKMQNLVEKLNDGLNIVFSDPKVFRFEVGERRSLTFQENEEIFREVLRAYLWFPRIRS